MAASLRLVRGPLEDEGLRAIARLYGPWNPKYADPEFCRRVFCGNVHGWALHAFLVADSGREVGHYAIVPLTLSRAGVPVESGKGEAWAIDEAFRGETLTLEDGAEVPCGIAMAAALYRFAAEHGLDPVHMVASDDIGLLHRMAGCRSMRVANTRFTLSLDAVRQARSEPALARRLFVFAAALAQSVAAHLLAAVSTSHRPWRSWRVTDLPPDALARLADRLPAATDGGLLLDAATLDWYARIGALEVVALDECFDDFLLLCPRVDQDRVAEVLACGLRSRTTAAAMRLLQGAAARGRLARDQVLTLSTLTVGTDEALALLFGAARRTLFRRAERKLLMLVRASDSAYLDPARFHVSAFFYAVF